MITAKIIKKKLETWINENIQVVTQLSKIYVWKIYIQKKEHMYIGREDEKNILSYVDFTRLRNVMSRFPELSIDILTNGISFPLSSSTRAF